MGDADREANVKVTRSRLMIAIAAGNASALTEVCGSVAAEWAAELQSEVAAAKKAIELVRGHEAAVKSLDEERAAVLRLRTELAALGEQHRASAGEIGEADDVIHGLKAQLSGAELRASGRAPASAAEELSSVQRETRINELQTVIVSLQTQLRQAEQAAAHARAETATAQAGLQPMSAANGELQEQQAHLRRMLEQSDAMSAALQQQVSALQAQAALPSGLGALEAAAAAATADAAAGGPAVEPGSFDEARGQLVSERARRQLCERELLTLKRQTDDALDRQLTLALTLPLTLTLTLALTLTLPLSLPLTLTLTLTLTPNPHPAPDT